MADLIGKLTPILHVKDPGTERDFYEKLGLRTTYEGPEYPGSIAVGNGAVEFGLSSNHETDPAGVGLAWQFEVTTGRPRKDWVYRVLKVRSPNGRDVLLEENGG
jgi:hypothetical protein